MTWVAFSCGLLIGSFVGIILASLAAAAGRGER
jgi:uncharacterized membrane-anchored protein YhcB (DUF1043 family)